MGGDNTICISSSDNSIDDNSHSANDTSETNAYSNTSINVPEPHEGMEFDTLNSAEALYTAYAHRLGFNTRVRMSHHNRDGFFVQRSFVCSKEGFHTFTPTKKRPRTINSVGCKAAMVVTIQENNKWVVSSFIKEHNHNLVTPEKCRSVRLQPDGIGNVGFSEYVMCSKRRNLGGDTQILLDYLKEKNLKDLSFSYSVEGDDERLRSNVFWVDSKAKLNYGYFGDTVTVDASNRRNGYKLPLVTITGLNHHGHPVLFGCALMADESEASFVWLFKTWLAAMAGRPPASVTTDNRVIQLAVKQVLPNTRHRFCKWHIFKECQDKLSRVYSKHPNFEDELQKCVIFSYSVEEFESCWTSLIDRYKLSGNVGLQSVYAHREQWVPAYFRDTFFAEIYDTRSSDSMNSYFDGYVIASTTLQEFVRLYEKAMKSRYEKEVKEDYETINTIPVLKTPSPIEKQAAEVYTRKLFLKFQEELVETLTFSATKLQEEQESTTYRVSEFGETHNSCSVRLNAREMETTCSCKMFQFSGMLCRHILTVFRVANIRTLPPCYILKRWTRSAKSGLVLEEQPSSTLNTSLETRSLRYNNLRHEALNCVNEGAKTVENHNVAVDALREAKNKVTIEQRNGGKTGTVCGTSGGVNENNHSQRDHQPDLGQPQSTDEQKRKIRKLLRQLECLQQDCEVYRASINSVLKDTEQQKLQLIVKAHNIKLAADQFAPEVLECVKEDIDHLKHQQAKLEQVLNSVGNQPVSCIAPSPDNIPIMLRRNSDNVDISQLTKSANDMRVEPTNEVHERGAIGAREGTLCSLDRENTQIITQVKDGHRDSFVCFESPPNPSASVMKERLVPAAILLDSPPHIENLPTEQLSNEILRSSSLEALETLEAVIRDWGSRSSTHGETLAQMKSQVDSSEKRAHLAETELLTLRQSHQKTVEDASSHQNKLVELQWQLTTASEKLAGEIATREAAETEQERLKKVLQSLTTELGFMKTRAEEAEKKAADDLRNVESASNQVVGLRERLDREFGLGFFSGYRDLRERVNAEHPEWDLSSFEPLQSLVWESDT